MDHHSGPFSIPAIHHFIPEKLRPWVVILFVICFQFSGGIYLAAISEMVGSTALMQEDILMIGYASMVGMSLTFTVMFRLKFAVKPKITLLICCSVLIICNLICMHCSNIPLLVATSFIAGIFRMWATFECNSTIQLWLTPKRDMSIFFCYVYLLVQGCIQLSGVTTIYTSVFAKWEYMHLLIIGMLLCVMIATLLIYNNKRFIRKLPLFGIDWLGGAMWGITILSIIFICIYGEHYDWRNSEWIIMASICGILTLALNLFRASFIRHPFISLKTWQFKVVWITLSIYIIFDILIAPAHILEHIFQSSILGYDELNTLSLNWISIIGIISGVIFTFHFFAIKKASYQSMTVTSFACVTIYLLIYYFTIDYNLPKESLYIPVFCRSFGYVILAITLITALMRVPFEYFFQSISIQGFVSAGIGSVCGSAIIGRVFNILLRKNTMLLSSGIDNVAISTLGVRMEELYGSVMQQAVVVTIKEIYGWLSIIALTCLLYFLVAKTGIRPLSLIHPSFRKLRNLMKYQLFDS